jgi:type II secretory pathway component HofQ
VIVEQRTNSLIVTETSAKLAEIRELIDRVDIPIRQVMIESRIVIAQSDLEEELGIQLGRRLPESGRQRQYPVHRRRFGQCRGAEQLGDQRHAADLSYPGA